MVRYAILGLIELCDGQRRVTVEGRRQVAVLASLLMHANRTVSADQLIDAVWSDGLAGGERKRLQMTIARLRRTLALCAPTGRPPLRTVAGGYTLDVRPGELDADIFVARVEIGRRALDAGQPLRAAEALHEALALWRGPALAQVAYEEFAQTEIRRLEDLRLTALQARVEADLHRGRHAALIGELETLVACNPTRERFVEQLMVALYRCGRQSEALDAYQRVRVRLAAELGLEPGPALRALQAQILEQAPALAAVGAGPGIAVEALDKGASAEIRHEDLHETLLPGEADVHGAAPSAARADPPRARGPTRTVAPAAIAPVWRRLVPALPARLLGREQEVQTVTDQLRQADVRIVTLTGAGGVGKTSLAIEVGRRLAGELADGAVFVDLAPLSDSRYVAATILDVLGGAAEASASPAEALCHEIAGREQLLILDNFEHVLAAAPLLVELLQAAPRLRLLVTSRIALRLRAERRYRVGPLALPANHEPSAVAAAPATALFIARATAQDPCFRLTSGNADAIATICARLDGLPLAIELAATRCSVLSAEEIASGLGRVLPGLRLGSPDAPKRHRTLRATLDWSCDLLDADEQLTFAKLSVFAGGFTLEAFEAVCFADDSAGALEALARMVDASLVLGERRGGRTRYRLLETMREYAAERLARAGEDETVKRRHARYYLGLAERAEPQLLTGSSQAPWLHCLALEHDNFRAALESSLAAGVAEHSLRLASALAWFWYLHGHYREGYGWLCRALAAGAASSAAARAKALRASGILTLLQCDYARAVELLEASLDLYRDLGDRCGIACSLQVLGSVARERADYERAVVHHAESLALSRELDDAHGIARSMNYLGFVAWLTGDYEQAEALSEETLRRFRELGDAEGIVWSLLNLGAAARYRKNYDPARAFCDNALKLSREIGYEEGTAWALNLLGVVAHCQGDIAGASAALVESLSGHAKLGDRWRAASVLDALAALGSEQCDALRCARLFGAAQAEREAIGTPVPRCEREERQHYVAAARARAGATAFNGAWQQGRAMTLEQAVAEARITAWREAA